MLFRSEADLTITIEDAYHGTTRGVTLRGDNGGGEKTLQVKIPAGTTEGTARVAVHRLRKRYREMFRAAVADTVSEPEEVDDEVRHLATVLGGG